jgi:D-glycero-alpha-D-manno-heptose-7-phosphate kinase
MIISRTPFRISFFGGGTDYPEWFQRYEGSTISTTIDKYCYINLRTLPPFFNHKYRFRYFEREEVNDINHIKHPSIKHCLKYLGFEKIKQGLEVVHNALYAYKNELITKKKLARDAIYVERNLIGEKVGSQDQTAAAFGGFNYARYEPNGNINVQNIFLSEEEIKKFERNSVLLFTGLQRKANNIAHEKVNNIKKDKSSKSLEIMKKLTQQAMNEIFSSKKIDYKKLGAALTEQWELKKNLSKKVSNRFIDNMFSLAKNNGAYGGKLLGAGGGGFLLFLVPENKKNKFLKKFSKQLHVPFRFDNTGSQIVYYSR